SLRVHLQPAGRFPLDYTSATVAEGDFFRAHAVREPGPSSNQEFIQGRRRLRGPPSTIADGAHGERTPSRQSRLAEGLEGIFPNDELIRSIGPREVEQWGVITAQGEESDPRVWQDRPGGREIQSLTKLGGDLPEFFRGDPPGS